jgi:hypothetical protein
LVDGATIETLYHVTVLSNLVRGYDKYARIYDKSKIIESTFPGRFFLLAKDEVDALHFIDREACLQEVRIEEAWARPSKSSSAVLMTTTLAHINLLCAAP